MCVRVTKQYFYLTNFTSTNRSFHCFIYFDFAKNWKKNFLHRLIDSYQKKTNKHLGKNNIKNNLIDFIKCKKKKTQRNTVTKKCKVNCILRNLTCRLFKGKKNKRCALSGNSIFNLKLFNNVNNVKNSTIFVP